MIHGYAGQLEEKLQHYRLKKEEKTDRFVLSSFSQLVVKKIYFSILIFSKTREANSLKT